MAEVKGVSGINEADCKLDTAGGSTEEEVGDDGRRAGGSGWELVDSREGAVLAGDVDVSFLDCSSPFIDRLPFFSRTRSTCLEFLIEHTRHQISSMCFTFTVFPVADFLLLTGRSPSSMSPLDLASSYRANLISLITWSLVTVVSSVLMNSDFN